MPPVAVRINESGKNQAPPAVHRLGAGILCQRLGAGPNKGDLVLTDSDCAVFQDASFPVHGDHQTVDEQNGSPLQMSHLLTVFS